MIYSFDGGSKESYERLRPGRFKENVFEDVYENIRRFARIREETGAKFPRTKIQMILTRDTFEEQETFFRLFSDCVDDVSVKAYTERGGSVADLDAASRRKLQGFLEMRGLPVSTPYWKDMDGNLFVSKGRLPCEQPFQRLIVAYDGRVSMCCYDWGSEYPIGNVDSRAIADGDSAYTEVLQKVEQKARGFERFGSLRMPNRYLSPPQSVHSLVEVWHGDIVNGVREKHVQGQLEQVPVCRLCPFKETYNWVKVGM
jgi:hypothetical protein